MGIQVVELTKGLMPWGKEYIDFSFAGRHISEFGLVAASSGDRYSFKGSPEFQDETSTVNGVWGQYYWGTNFKTITYEYSLATDGMTERQFDEFKRLFQPGKYGQFYEDTWFDRYCYVRVKSVVNFTFVPFQEDAEIAGVKFKSRIYKGECKLTLIQDRPFKYAFQQVLDTRLSELSTSSDNGEAALRMMYHSNIPALDSWDKLEKCCTGSWISLPAYGSEDTTDLFKKSDHIAFYNPSTFNAETQLSFTIDRTISEMNLEEWEPIYFNEIYNDITNPTLPYNIIGVTESLLYNTSLKSDKAKRISKEFKYSLPEVSSEVNKAIQTAWDFYCENKNGSLATLQERIQESLINGKVLMWAVRTLQKIQNNSSFYYSNEDVDTLLIDDSLTSKEIKPVEEAKETGMGTVYFYSSFNNDFGKDEDLSTPGCLRSNKVTAYIKNISQENPSIEVDWFGYFNIMMLMIFAECNPGEQNDILTEDVFGKFYDYTLHFNGEKGQAFIDYTINQLNSDSIITNLTILEENCSNIIASDYLKVDGGDQIDISTGKIASYHVLRFKHGKQEDLTVRNIRLQYKYTYM